MELWVALTEETNIWHIRWVVILKGEVEKHLFYLHQPLLKYILTRCSNILVPCWANAFSFGYATLFRRQKRERGKVTPALWMTAVRKGRERGYVDSVGSTPQGSAASSEPWPRRKVGRKGELPYFPSISSTFSPMFSPSSAAVLSCYCCRLLIDVETR